jgi:hypothetical protein
MSRREKGQGRRESQIEKANSNGAAYCYILFRKALSVPLVVTPLRSPSQGVRNGAVIYIKRGADCKPQGFLVLQLYAQAKRERLEAGGQSGRRDLHATDLKRHSFKLTQRPLRPNQRTAQPHEADVSATKDGTTLS